MDDLSVLLSWAWARHLNPLSWYIRPLFVVLFCYCAWKRSRIGLVLVVLATLSSIAWFPAPAVPDPVLQGYLDAELHWLSDPALVTAMLALILLALWAMAAAFWTRRWLYAVVTLNAIPVLKIVFSVALGGAAGWAALPPALACLLVCDAVVVTVIWRRWRSRPQL